MFFENTLKVFEKDGQIYSLVELKPQTGRTHQLRVHAASQGWAIVDQELEEGLISMSAPIRDRQGRVIAALNISGNAQRKNAKQMVKAFLEPLQDAAQRVSDMVARRG